MALRRLVLWCVAGLILPGVCSAGPLNPPLGPVSPTYKTLDQVRPGTPIESVPYVIASPGVYYLTGNIDGAGLAGGPDPAITVAASNVTLDLAGFTLSGPGADSGIVGVSSAADAANMRLSDGTITGFGIGIDAPGRNARLSGLRVAGNGLGMSVTASLIADCAATENLTVGIMTRAGQYFVPGYDGVAVSGGVVVERCAAIANGEAGFVLAEGALLIDSAASINKRLGIDTTGACRIQRCTIDGTLADGGVPGYGVSLTTGSIICDSTVRGCANGGVFLSSSRNAVKNCNISANGDFGIGGPSGANGYYCDISGCHVSGHVGSPGYGISVVDNCSITNNIVINNYEAGISLAGSASRVVGNMGRGNGHNGGAFNFSGQIVSFGSRNHIEGNTCVDGPRNGIVTVGSRNVVIRNVCGGNPNTNYINGPETVLGPIIDRTASGGATSAGDPFANLSY